MVDRPSAPIIAIEAAVSPRGYQEISRTALIKPTSNSGNRCELGAGLILRMANRHVIARNDEEIISLSLEKWQASTPD